MEAAIGKAVIAAMPAALRAASDCAERVSVELVVCSVTFPGGPDLAEAHGAALVTVALAPVFPTSRFPFFMLSVGPFGCCLNRASYLMPAMGRAMHRAALTQWRRESLRYASRCCLFSSVCYILTKPRHSYMTHVADLRLSGRGPTLLEMGCRTDGSVAPRICCVSPSVVPQPDDWDSATTTMTGYLRLEGEAEWTPDAALATFLTCADSSSDAAAEAKPVVYIGFGSMTRLEPAVLEAIVLPAVRETGVRAVLQLGWSGSVASSRTASQDVFYLDSAPHANLFPLVSAVVHHGGAGTTAAGLAAGRPTLICPVGADQFMWAARVHELGCGPAPIDLVRLTSSLLAARLRALVGNVGFRARATELAAHIAREDGLVLAIKVIEAEGRRCGKMPPAAAAARHGVRHE